jgi:hypothetical protein
MLLEFAPIRQIMKGIKTIELVANALQSVAFPTLSRPPVKATDAPTEDLIRWGIKMYAYSVAAHLRKMLEGLIQLASAENIPAANVVSRHIFEWTAHACYISRNLDNYVRRQEWERAWSLLSRAVIGNIWIKQHGGKYSSPAAQLPANVPDPLEVPNIVGAYEQYLSQRQGVKTAKDNYGFLSELSHPNAACLQQYHKVGGNPRDVEIADAEPPISPLPFVNWCLLDLLHFLDALLDLSKETTIRPSVSSILSEISKRAPSTRT